MKISAELQEKFLSWKNELTDELKNSILAFWLDYMADSEYGGFYGFVDNSNTVKKEASKGLVMHGRFLWTYSAAFRIFKDPVYFHAAQKALVFLEEKLKDPEFGGYYWQCSREGKTLETKKQIYGQAFVIYGLSEFVRAGGPAEAGEKAYGLFTLLEKYARDRENGGYYEALEQTWSMPDGGKTALSEKDPDCVKSMNTNLHVLEAFTNLYRVNRNEKLREALAALVSVSCEKIINKKTNHLMLFFDKNWNTQEDINSFGHDIEATWLIMEAIDVLDDDTLRRRYRDLLVRMIDTVIEEGMDPNGGLNNEFRDGHLDKDKHWWPQAEMMIGLFNGWEMTGKKSYLDLVEKVWQFIKKEIKAENGDWFWGRKADGGLMRNEKGGIWKTPYHNGRLCMEYIERIKKYEKRGC